MASVLDPILRHAAEERGRIALRDERGDWTYGDVAGAAEAFGADLQASGMAPGTHMVLIAPSVPEFVVAYLGIAAAGCVVIPMNTMSVRDEIRYVLNDSGAARIIAWDALGAAAREAADDLGVPLQVLRQLTPGAHRPVGSESAICPRDRSDTAAILYTSGTTGRPKGAELSVANILDSAEISVQIGRSTPQDRFATGLPLFHVFGQIAVMMSALTAGASLSLLSPFEPNRMLELIRRDQISIVLGVPTMWNAMLRAAEGAGDGDFAGVRAAVSGGASLPAEVSRAFERRFGCPVIEGYGLTESSALGTFNDLDRGPKIGSTGAPIPRSEIQIRSLDGQVVAQGEVGEVFMRGPQVMKGYWNRPEATAEAFVDGWFRTGDLGALDADGDLRIVDRLKDLIIRGGYNVYPGEVEEVLYGHPDIIEVAVVGVPDEYYGQEVAAVITLRDGASVTGEEITAWSRERMSAYKIPRIVRFVPTLPKGATGKILKRAIDLSDGETR
ncbi:MAG: long-chain fatty acid--CoA ligase [Actinomycetota bacterium]|nr:long-chain fatty acid--CoA ligase [Actinomycetota bacterium]